MAYGRNYYPDQQVFVGQLGAAAQELKGVQSFDGSWNIPYEQMMAGGYNYVGTEIGGELVGEVSVSRSIITSGDPITGLINSPVSGYLIYGPKETYDKAFNFSRGYINSYESSCSLGEVASCDFGLTAYGGIGKINDESRTYTPISPDVATADNISLTTDFGSTNAIQSYSLGITFDRTPVNKIGQDFAPTEFTTAMPIVASISFEVLANDYEIQNIREVVCAGFTSNLVVELNKCGGDNIRTFRLSDAKMVDSSLQAGIGNDMSISLSYESYYSSITGAMEAIMA